MKALSTWQPPVSDVDTGIFDYVRSVSQDLAVRFYVAKCASESVQARRNLLECDKVAITWLSQHRQLIDVQADKGMGHVLLPRPLYDKYLSEQFDLSFSECRESDVIKAVESGRVYLQNVVSDARSHVLFSKKDAEFLMFRFQCSSTGRPNYRFPFARGLIKVHKKRNSARLIVSGTRWVYNPAAPILAWYLQTAVALVPSVAASTDSVVGDLTKFAAQMGPSDQAFKTATFDVESSYPTLDQLKAILAVRCVLQNYFTQHPQHKYGLMIETLVSFVGFLFMLQLCWFKYGSGAEVRYFKQYRGLSAGISAGTPIGNSYLLLLDCYVADQLGKCLRFFSRYVDDIFVIFTDVSRLFILDLLNSFHDAVTITNDSSESDFKTTFLDLEIDLYDGRRLSFRTYRKLGNAYCYLPAASCHPPLVFPN